MKVFVAVLTIAVFAAFSSATVLPELIEEKLHSEMIGEPRQNQETDALVSHTRQRRFTCDAFSFSSAWVTPNHSACAIKCVGMGRKGGHCENNNCVCRDDSYI